MKRARRAAAAAAVVPAVVGPAVGAAYDGGTVLVADMLSVAVVVAVVGAVALAVPGIRAGWLLLAAALTAAWRPGAAAGPRCARSA